MRTFASRHLVALTLVAACALSTPVHAQEQEERKSAGPAVADALIVRPMMLARTLLGLGTLIVTLPFTAPGDNVDEAAEVLVVEPARDLFLRPLGERSRE